MHKLIGLSYVYNYTRRIANYTMIQLTCMSIGVEVAIPLRECLSEFARECLLQFYVAIFLRLYFSYHVRVLIIPEAGNLGNSCDKILTITGLFQQP